jgi:hypothetical protein
MREDRYPTQSFMMRRSGVAVDHAGKRCFSSQAIHAGWITVLAGRLRLPTEAREAAQQLHSKRFGAKIKTSADSIIHD